MQMISIKKAAELLAVSQRTIYNMIKRGDIKIAAKFGDSRQSRVRIDQESIIEFQKNHQLKGNL